MLRIYLLFLIWCVFLGRSFSSISKKPGSRPGDLVEVSRLIVLDRSGTASMPPGQVWSPVDSVLGKRSFSFTSFEFTDSGNSYQKPPKGANIFLC